MPYADLTDVRCYYELLGSGEPVLLIPGLGTTCRLWDGITPELSAAFSLILVDNRGVGRSIGKRAARSLDELAVDLIELLDTLQIDRAHVIGLSLGGIIAQRLAVDHPSRVDRLVLVSCTHHFAGYLREMAHLLGHALRYFPKESFYRTVEVLGTSPQYLDEHPDYMQQALLACKIAPPSRVAVARQLQCLGCSDMAAEDFRIASPTLVIAGERDGIIPSCYGRQMAADIPGAELLLVPECGHNPFIEKPEVVVPKIIEFLDRSRLERQMSYSQLEESLA